MTLLRKTGLGIALLAAGVLATSAAADTRVSKQLGEELERYVRGRADASVSEINIPELSAFDELGLPADELDVSFRTHKTGRLSGRTPVTVILNHAGREVKRGVVTVGLIAYKHIYVAARGVRKGEVVEEGDIRRVRRDMSTLRGAVITRSSDLVGMRVRRSLPAGRAWQPRYLETIPTVRRGELVRLRLESGGLRIDGTGKAGADGRPGEFIRVLNAASKRYVTGRVDEEGTVHVRF
ncbi:MAG: flagellar basal body P-ring formation chaperone FlgA [Myxococcota bacterium]|jgi:flagella basal body P-ring formation protein FlgA|nr:flagellar basal body P-ring formation chaperone FlgA [Myxococcota bacterium]